MKIKHAEVSRIKDRGYHGTANGCSNDLMIRNLGRHHHNILIGVATLGTIRYEWHVHRRNQILPINWQSGEITANHQLDSVAALGYNTEDAQNVCVHHALKNDYEWCFRGDTLIETSNGAKPIRDVWVGELVKTHTGKWRPVLKTMKRDLPQRAPTIWIRTENSTIKCTPGHPFLVFRNGGPQWEEAASIMNGDRLLYPDNPHKDKLNFDVRYSDNGRMPGSKLFGKRVTEIEVDQSLARFLGLYLAEGHSCRDHVAFTFGNHERESIAFICDTAQRIFGREPKIHVTWASQVRLSIRSLAKRFNEWFGRGAKNKKVPAFVFDWSLQNKLAFLSGFFDGDGSYPDGGGCVFSSASKELIHDVVRLGKSCGLCFSKVNRIQTENPLRHLHGGTLKTQIRYDCRLPVKALAKLKDLRTAERYGEYLEVRVLAVEKHPLAANLIDSAVYNLEVADDNSYIADSAAVHNCLLWEDDVLPPFNALVLLDTYVSSKKYPIISGLYYSKSIPSWPLVFRRRGNGAYLDFTLGDKVWCDGVPTGFILIHTSIIKYVAEHSEEYTAPDGNRVRRVFRFPREAWFDPEADAYFAKMGTSDLHFCERVMTEKVYENLGWARKIPDMKYPFLVDTRLLCRQIDLGGRIYPDHVEAIHPRGNCRNGKAKIPGGSFVSLRGKIKK